jgi:hypothetical protein
MWRTKIDIKSLKFRKACGIDDVPNEFLRHLPRRPLVHLTHLFNYCIRISQFTASWKEAKVITLPKPGRDNKFPQNLRPISLFSNADKSFEKVIPKIVQWHVEGINLLDASQFSFRALHSTTLQCMRLPDHANLNLNSNMSMAAVFLDIEIAFDVTSLACYKNDQNYNFKSKYWSSLALYCETGKFNVSVEGEMAALREIQAEVPQGSALAPTLDSLYINYAPQTPCAHLILFADDTCVYCTDYKGSYVPKKLQRGITRRSRGVSAGT